MSESVRIPQPHEVLFGGGAAVSCGLDGQISAEEAQGLFAGDTRVLSTYRLGVGGGRWELLGRWREGHGTAHWEFQNPLFRSGSEEIAAGMLLLSLRRRVDGAMHDDLCLRSFVQRTVRVRLTLQIDADFADIFQVRYSSLPPRLAVLRATHERGFDLGYERAGFRRGLRVAVRSDGPAPAIGGPQITFEVELAHGAEWTCCVEAVPVLDGEPLKHQADPHDLEPDSVPHADRPAVESEALLQDAYARGQADLRALAVDQPNWPPYAAAGAPWFLTLFGRDSLLAGMMSSLDGTWATEGALAALGEMQATEPDDWRDAQPGKLPHETRRGELARFGEVPHARYYGAHDTQALYCLALWEAWRWRGDRGLLQAHLERALLALRWCDEFGDRDGDGLQEYETRSKQGYRNQGWKDRDDAIVDAGGAQAETPIALVEHQGYLFAARLAMADLLAGAGDEDGAARLREQAALLRVRVEETFWIEQDLFYALGLDGRKRPLAAIASNPGHLLWCGLSSRERAERLAVRLLSGDMFTGWGLRCLSSDNPAYNPLSYHRGSVWPHDTALVAAGLWRYGLRAEASMLLRAVLEAAAVFEGQRLPEVFGGLDRAHGLPVPYKGSNIPQAWSAAVPLLAARLFLGIVPDAPSGRCHLSPWLPDWLPSLRVRGIAVGKGKLDIAITRRGDDTLITNLVVQDLQIVEDFPEAPLWGAPPVI